MKLLTLKQHPSIYLRGIQALNFHALTKYAVIVSGYQSRSVDYSTVSAVGDQRTLILRAALWKYL